MRKLKSHFSSQKEKFANLKISFLAIKSSKSFEIEENLIAFNGKFEPINPNLVKCKGKICGKLDHICDKCGKDIVINLDFEVDFA